MNAKEKMTGADVVAILSACAQSGVAVLKYGGLYVRFEGRPVVALNTSPEVQSAPHSPTEEIVEIQKKISKQSMEVDELDLREEQVAEMLLTDPYQAEQMLINEQLEDHGATGDEEAQPGGS